MHAHNTYTPQKTMLRAETLTHVQCQALHLAGRNINRGMRHSAPYFTHTHIHTTAKG
jgi:hypothetical protein